VRVGLILYVVTVVNTELRSLVMVIHLLQSWYGIEAIGGLMIVNSAFSIQTTYELSDSGQCPLNALCTIVSLLTWLNYQSSEYSSA